ncbi:MAG: hypothetical protein RMK29_11485 [Myxococcales bacterium]|nr:hypothetical protein [Myxococcota bacterium]MDW8282330.1 hypothetical protein [Myxococcales bacterium]
MVSLLVGCALASCLQQDLQEPDLTPVPDGGRGSERWTVIRPPAPGEANLFALWGDQPDHLFAVGSGGTILRAVPDPEGRLDRDGRPLLLWTRMDSGTTADLTAVHGTSPTDVYAVGLGGTILRYDGSTWQAEAPQRAMPDDPPLSADLWGVFAYSGGAMAVGKGGVWTRRVMGRWQVPGRLQVEGLRGLWGTAPNSLWAVGSLGFIYFFNGTGWSVVSPPGFTNKLAAVFGTAANNVYAVGLAGSVLRKGDGGFIDLGARIDARCGSGPVPRVFLRGGAVTASGDVVLIGWEGVIVRLSSGCADGGMGLAAWDESGSTSHRLEGIWAQRDGARTTIYISGVAGLVLRGE